MNSSSLRFTIDGDNSLENQIGASCTRALSGIRGLLPERRLEAVLLAGGYGRGEGGVMRGPQGDLPYNDLEFYVAMAGNRHLNELRFHRRLQVLGELLTHLAGLEVEFKITSLSDLAEGPVTMFSYDLVCGHRVLWGRGPDPHCPAWHRHRNPGNIPQEEATRLLMNRCSGLLFARTKLEREPLTPSAADYVRRNVAKAQLACGDAVLVAWGMYHWSCRVRHTRLRELVLREPSSWLRAVVLNHASGMAFKLHPKFGESEKPPLVQTHREVTELALQCWLWLESRRLGRPFPTARAYAEDNADKWPDSSPVFDFLLNMRANGLRPRMDPKPWWHPRQRILRALALLLWDPEAISEPRVRRRLEAELNVPSAAAGADWMGAYQELWCRVR